MGRITSYDETLRLSVEYRMTSIINRTIAHSALPESKIINKKSMSMRLTIVTIIIEGYRNRDLGAAVMRFIVEMSRPFEHYCKPFSLQTEKNRTRTLHKDFIQADFLTAAANT